MLNFVRSTEKLELNVMSEETFVGAHELCVVVVGDRNQPVIGTYRVRVHAKQHRGLIVSS